MLGLKEAEFYPDNLVTNNNPKFNDSTINTEMKNFYPSNNLDNLNKSVSSNFYSSNEIENSSKIIYRSPENYSPSSHNNHQNHFERFSPTITHDKSDSAFYQNENANPFNSSNDSFYMQDPQMSGEPQDNFEMHSFFGGQNQNNPFSHHSSSFEMNDSLSSSFKEVNGNHLDSLFNFNLINNNNNNPMINENNGLNSIQSNSNFEAAQIILNKLGIEKKHLEIWKIKLKKWIYNHLIELIKFFKLISNNPNINNPNQIQSYLLLNFDVLGSNFREYVIKRIFGFFFFFNFF